MCWWSIEKLRYADDYMYAAKVETPSGVCVPARVHCRSSHCACPCSEDEPDKKWNEMPGLRWNTPVEKTQFKVTYEECKDKCTEGALSLSCDSTHTLLAQRAKRASV